MKFRYFILQGESLKVFLDSEKDEMNQRKAMKKALLEDRDDIDSFRVGSGGDVFSVKFKEGKQPDCFIRAHKNLPDEDVRPHGKSKDAKPWRELFKSLKATEDCQSVLTKHMKLPDFVLGEAATGGYGRKCYSSRTGHVGADVYIEVPVSEEKEAYEPHADMKEVKVWEFEKAIEEAEGYDYGQVYTISSRVS